MRWALGLCGLLMTACPSDPGRRAPADPGSDPSRPSTSAVAESSVEPAEGPDAGGGEASLDGGADALVVDISEPYVPEPASPASLKGCPKFPPRGMFGWKTIPELAGTDRKHVVSCYGEPADRKDNPWRFQQPKGCSYEKIEIEVFFSGDLVQRARARGFVTGQHCDFAF